MDFVTTRRRFLTTTTLSAAALAGTALLPGPAHAFSVEPGSAEAKRLYLAACSAKDGAYHRELVAEVKERLKDQATEAEIEAAIAATTCPICGCPISAS